MSMLLNESGFTAKKKVLAIALSLLVLFTAVYAGVSYFASSSDDVMLGDSAEFPPSFEIEFEKSDLLGNAALDSCLIPGQVFAAGAEFDASGRGDALDLKAGAVNVFYVDLWIIRFCLWDIIL